MTERLEVEETDGGFRVIDQAGIELAHVFRRSEAFAFARDRGARVHLKWERTVIGGRAVPQDFSARHGEHGAGRIMPTSAVINPAAGHGSSTAPIPTRVEAAAWVDEKVQKSRQSSSWRRLTPNSLPMATNMDAGRRMTDSMAALAKLLADNPGPVSIVAGIPALRVIGAAESDVDLQSLIGSFAAERWRAVRFDRFTESP
ncbi:hypothetical protein [Mesorhizobium sp. M0146]|uniref:hypothetical protein n=1 Tax=unclassified Mesorhizobium TaxID=325217 RepID=UPI00333A9C88